MTNVREKLRRFIVETFLFGEERDLADNTSLLEEGIVDSTGVMELVAFLEQEYDINVHDEELVPENLDSIGNILAYLKRKKPLA